MDSVPLAERGSPGVILRAVSQLALCFTDDTVTEEFRAARRTTRSSVLAVAR